MKNFIFDLYNTLIHIRTDEYRDETWRPVVEFFREHGIDTDVETLRTLYGQGWDSMLSRLGKSKKFKYPECDITDIFGEMAKRQGVEFSREVCEEAAKCMRRASRIEMSVFQGVHELFIKLRSLGAKIYLLSNAQAAFTYDEIEECGLLSRFDGLLLSSECACRKPDPAFFKMLFEKFSLDKRASVMIGDDKETDGKGAKSFGIHFVHAPLGAAAVADKLIKLVNGK